MAKLNPKIDFSAIGAQFQGLRERHPGLWPVLPKAGLLTLLVAGVMALAWAFYWQGLLDELERRRGEEVQLRGQFVDKMKQAVNLPVLRKQKEQVMQYVSQLEKQLPSKAEMDALLSDINQAGVGRGLQFDLFKPGQVMVREYYAELPISIRLSGNYHDFAAFTSDVANLPRIVTLHDIRISVPENQARGSSVTPGGPLLMEATAKTFRYLDAEEIAEQKRKEAAAKAPAGKKARPAAGGKKS
ncbi:type 4a pilus biogenesis protein PilO [Burkholderiaceae bacterium FT117]|uniref:type 4a pilus biogenesis protein PilO n=1 Tax=Zeimonas sediminis TaxID=2944268 RepID=UPI0023431C14|nr:type 4a pilus biogenesis protein PilO [Zeimonas sediminis]MCM5570873.1 type 4a pilus biogenesis protein PilO [Zeimonas sediminis]